MMSINANQDDRPAIRCEGLNVGYSRTPEERVLEGIDASVYCGEVIGFLGPNGAGKTTLLKSLIGLIPSLEGEIRLDGSNITHLTNHQRALKVAAAFTDNSYNGSISAYEFVAAGRIPHSNFLGRLNKADHKAIREAIQMLGCTLLAERRLRSLSDGQRQRFVIARAIAQQTKVILFDEPTAFLDHSGRIFLFKLLRQLSEEQNRAIIISTHEVDLALKYTDQIWLIDSNKQFQTAPTSSVSLQTDGETLTIDQ